jgi:hypothetical protein
MTKFKKILLGSAAILLPGGFLVITGLLAYKKFRRKRDAIHSEASDTNNSENQNKVNS